jgi:hypothetical protein
MKILTLLKLNYFNMDEHVSKNPLNPINWDGEYETCKICETKLDSFDDYEDICQACWEHRQNDIEEVENL